MTDKTIKRSTIRTTAAILTLTMGMNSCANIKDDQTRTKTEGTLLGAGIGAVLGAGSAAIASGGNTSSILKGAAIGAIAGGALGHAYGSKVVARKAEYASNEAYLQDCIVELRDERSRVAASNAKTRKTIAAQKQELDQLLALQRNNAPTRQRFVALNRSAGASLKVANENMKRTNVLIQEHESALRGSSDSATGPWKSELVRLKAERSELQASINSLNAIEARSGQLIAQSQ